MISTLCVIQCSIIVVGDDMIAAAFVFIEEHFTIHDTNVVHITDYHTSEWLEFIAKIGKGSGIV